MIVSINNANLSYGSQWVRVCFHRHITLKLSLKRR